MEIEITGHHLEITAALRDFINKKFEKLMSHFDHIIKVHVVLDVEKLRQIAKATMSVRGNELHASAEAEDLYAAVDLLMGKLHRQLQEHKDKERRRN